MNIACDVCQFQLHRSLIPPSPSLLTKLNVINFLMLSLLNFPLIFHGALSPPFAKWLQSCQVHPPTSLKIFSFTLHWTLNKNIFCQNRYFLHYRTLEATHVHCFHICFHHIGREVLDLTQNKWWFLNQKFWSTLCKPFHSHLNELALNLLRMKTK